MLQRESAPPYVAEWPGLAAPVSDAASITPQLGLLFGAEDVAAIRRRAAQPGYADVMAGLRAAAREALLMEPEKRIRQFLPTGPGGRYARPRDRQPDMYLPAVICAFVGIDRPGSGPAAHGGALRPLHGAHGTLVRGRD